MFYIHSTTNKITLTKGDNADMVVNVYDAKGKERGKLGDWLAKRKKDGKDSEFVP